MAKDYFLRMIDQIAAVLEEIDERQRSGDNSGAKAELNSRSQQAVGLDISHIHRMSPEAVAQLSYGKPPFEDAKPSTQISTAVHIRHRNLSISARASFRSSSRLLCQ